MKCGVRLAVVVATMASILVPALVSPAKTILVPKTLAHTMAFTADRGSSSATFPVTHVAFSWTGPEGTGIRFRTVDGTGAPSGWSRARQSHDLERGDRHYSGVIAVSRPSRILWKAIEPRGKEVSDVVVDHINTVDGPLQERVVPAAAQAGATTPTIITRAQWGADESLKRTSGSCRRTFHRVQQLFVHHTAGANFDANPAATMRAIYWYHTVRRGWCDIGYNFVIGWDGRIFEGRWARRYNPWELHSSEDRYARAVAGAHVSGFNSGSVGISLMGNFMKVAAPPSMRRALAELLAWEADRHNLEPLSKHTYRNPETGKKKWLPYIAGHRDAGYTSCPGTLVYKALPAIRRDVSAVMGEGKPASTLELSAAASKVTFGDTVGVSGQLTDENGTGIAGAPITIYRREAREDWIVDAPVTTGLDGSFSFEITPEKNTVVAAAYNGSTAVWGSQSPNVRVRVMPDVSLAPEGATAAPTGTYHFPPGTSATILSGAVAPAHPKRAVTVKVFERLPDGTAVKLVDARVVLDDASRYSYSFMVPRAGTYQAITWMARDREHAAGHSPPVTFVVPD